MKKNLTMMAFVACAALTIVSCSNDEVADSAVKQKEQAIEFGTYVGRDVQSRGAVADIATVQNNSFGVFAYYTGGDDYTSSTSIAPNFMYDQKVTWDSGASKWTYTPVKYWPNNGYYPGTGTVDASFTDKITFMAYSPYSANSNSTVTPSAKDATGHAKLTFTVKDAVGEQVDLLAAKLENQRKQSTTGKLDFNFQHVLSRVGFTVATVVDDTGTTPSALHANTKIQVKKVELLGNFDKDATFNLYSQAWDLGTTTSASSYVWDQVDLVGGNVVELNSGETGPIKVNDDAKYAMLLPQTISDLTIKVTYDVITTDANLNSGNSTIENVVTSKAISSFDFEQGKAYTFNLLLGMTSVKVGASVSVWDDGGTTNVDVPENYN